jgi:ubiquinone/menaquinone biosynthesis C-methylase UbiE
MSDLYFKLMVCIYMVADPFYSPEERIKSFGISKGKTVIDYGCGPGRYLKGFSDAVGTKGRVYGADIHRLAILYSSRRIKQYSLGNVELVLVRGYHCGIADNSVDYICAPDMLHQVREPQL